MKNRNFRKGTCHACAYKIYKPEQRLLVMQHWTRKGYEVADMAFEQTAGKSYEIYYLQHKNKPDDKAVLYFDITDLFRLW